MALNPRLQSFASMPKIKQFSKILNAIEKDLRELVVSDYLVDIHQEINNESFLERFLSWQITKDSEPDQIMTVSGTAFSRPFRIKIPLRKGQTLPYFVEIELNVALQEKLEYHKGFMGGKWILEPENKEKQKKLKELKLPDINWTHSRSGVKFEIKIAHQFISSFENPAKSLWIINSGYQGFLVNIGPQTAKYIHAAQDVEIFLNTWNR